MGEEQIYSKINRLISGEGYSDRVGSPSEIRNFLNDHKNKGIKAYDEIEELYDLLMVGPGMW